MNVSGSNLVASKPHMGYLEHFLAAGVSTTQLSQLHPLRFISPIIGGHFIGPIIGGHFFKRCCVSAIPESW